VKFTQGLEITAVEVAEKELDCVKDRRGVGFDRNLVPARRKSKYRAVMTVATEALEV